MTESRFFSVEHLSGASYYRRSLYIMRAEARSIRFMLRLSFSFIIFLSNYTTSRCSGLIRATSMALRSSQERHNYIWRPDKRAGLWKMPKPSIRATDTAVWACIMEKWRILTGSGAFWWPIKLLSKMGSFRMPLSTCDVSLPIRAHITRLLAATECGIRICGSAFKNSDWLLNLLNSIALIVIKSSQSDYPYYTSFR